MDRYNFKNKENYPINIYGEFYRSIISTLFGSREQRYELQFPLYAAYPVSDYVKYGRKCIKAAGCFLLNFDTNDVKNALACL